MLENTLREVGSLYDQVVIEQKLAERLLLNVMPDVITIKPDGEIRPLIATFLETRRRDVATGTRSCFHRAGATPCQR